jgi:hypothetical protein
MLRPYTFCPPIDENSKFYDLSQETGKIGILSYNEKG